MPLKDDKLNDALMTRICIAALGRRKDHFYAVAARPEHVKIEPLRRYTPDLTAGDGDAFLRGAKLAGWRCAIKARTPGTVADMAGMIDINLTGNRPEFAGMMYKGTASDRFGAAVAFTKKWAEKQSEVYELRLLDMMTTLNANALWLAGPRDIFIPYWDTDVNLSGNFAVEDGYLDRIMRRKAGAEARHAASLKRCPPRIPRAGD